MSIPDRPVKVYIVHAESGQVTKVHEVDPNMTGPEITHWLTWLEAICGPDYLVEIPNGEAA